MAGGLKEVRERISSVKSTQQITKAMKMVSAAKLKKASDSITQMRPYTLKLQTMLSNVMASLGTGEELPNLSYAEQRDIEKVLIVLITSDRGLAGAFNSNLVKQAKYLINKPYSSQAAKGNVSLLTIGKKGFDAFKKENTTIDDQYISLFSSLEFETAAEVAEHLFDLFKSGTYDAIDVVFGEFKNAATQIIQSERFLPINLEFKGNIAQEVENKFENDYIFEPNKEELLSVLVPKILKTQFYRYLLDNNASEHGARMMAMEQATENANDLLKDLKLTYNRARQAAITKEISEIVGGVVALEG